MAATTIKDLLYGDILHSPGYEVDFAFGTTYSLGLDTAVIIPICLSSLGIPEGDLLTNQSRLLEAIRSTNRHLAIFYNNGQMPIPVKNMPIYPLFDNSVFPITQSGSFHPKMWVIREHSEEDVQIKFVILSRNLTFDNSLDVVVAMTGKLGPTPFGEQKHKPLADMMKYLAEKYAKNSDKYYGIISLANDLSYVERFETDDQFDDYSFYPLCPELGRGWNSIKDDIQGRSVFVISPFINDSGIDPLISRAWQNKSLITRADFVTQHILDSFDEVFAVNEGMIDNEFGKIDLHAKMYFVNQRDGYNYLFVGSANATPSAFNRNTEFLLRLRYKTYKKSFSQFREEFINSDNRFSRITSPAENASLFKEPTPEEIAFKQMLGSDIKAFVLPQGDSLYTVKVTFADIPTELDVALAPLQHKNKGQKVSSKGVTFTGLKTKELSEFFILSVGHRPSKVESIIKLPTEGIPDDRDKMIVQSIIDSKEKFIDYMSWKFAEDTEAYQLEYEQQMALMKNSPKKKGGILYTNLYEEMLKSFYRNPESINDVQEILGLVSEDVIPQGFQNLYDTFKSAQKTDSRGSKRFSTVYRQ